MTEIEKKEWAKTHEVSKRTIERWIEKGVDVRDKEAVEQHRATQWDRKPSDTALNALDDRARKLRAEADEREEKAILAKLKRQEQEGALVPVEDSCEAAQRYAAAVQAGLNRLQGELPTLLEGLTATEIEKVLEGKFDDALRKIADNVHNSIKQV